MNRRELMGATAAALVAGTLGSGSAAGQATTTAPAARLKLQTFGYGDVALTGGPLKAQYDHALAFYLNLDEDRALKVYRQAAGLPNPGEEMGGWYNADGFAPGHALGQWMSALSRFAAAGSKPAAEKVARLVDGFDQTLGKGRAFYDGHRFKAYVFDKHVIGLVDAFRYAGVERAREVLRRATDIAEPFLPEKALTRAEMRARPHKDISYTWDESYTNAENLFIAHQVLGDQRYLDLARRFLHDEPYFDRLARGEPAMVGEHAYSHVNALSSAAMAYILLGTQKHFDAVRNAWEMIVRDQQYATGGWGPNEEFIEPDSGKRFESLQTTRNHFETPCGSYATFKHARYLTQITGQSIYGDGLERVLYNGILAAKRIEPDGRNFYYADYADNARKTFHPERWTCCTGSYPQAIADYLLNAYYRSEDGMYVNLFVPSTLRMGDVTITQSTHFPAEGATTLIVQTPSPRRFVINLRIPAWAGDGATLAVNGEPLPAPKAGQFAPVERAWKAGDTIELSLPLNYRTEPIDARHPDTVALIRGPVMHVAVGDRPTLKLGGGAATPVLNESFRLMPFYQINDQVYSSYFTLTQ